MRNILLLLFLLIIFQSCAKDTDQVVSKVEGDKLEEQWIVMNML